jgi:hypothetical protein
MFCRLDVAPSFLKCKLLFAFYRENLFDYKSQRFGKTLETFGSQIFSLYFIGMDFPMNF